MPPKALPKGTVSISRFFQKRPAPAEESAPPATLASKRPRQEEPLSLPPSPAAPEPLSLPPSPSPGAAAVPSSPGAAAAVAAVAKAMQGAGAAAGGKKRPAVAAASGGASPPSSCPPSSYPPSSYPDPFAPENLAFDADRHRAFQELARSMFVDSVAAEGSPGGNGDGGGAAAADEAGGGDGGGGGGGESHPVFDQAMAGTGFQGTSPVPTTGKSRRTGKSPASAGGKSGTAAAGAGAAGAGAAGAAGASHTPLEEQYLRIRAANPGVLLVIEVGYKYKMFGDDAEVARDVLRVGAFKSHSFLNASFPVHRLPHHVRRLVEAGHKVGRGRG